MQRPFKNSSSLAIKGSSISLDLLSIDNHLVYSTVPCSAIPHDMHIFTLGLVLTGALISVVLRWRTTLMLLPWSSPSSASSQVSKERPRFLEVPLFHMDSNLYGVKVKVGKPPQTLHLLLDSGSGGVSLMTKSTSYCITNRHVCEMRGICSFHERYLLKNMLILHQMIRIARLPTNTLVATSTTDSLPAHPRKEIVPKNT